MFMAKKIKHQSFTWKLRRFPTPSLAVKESQSCWDLVSNGLSRSPSKIWFERNQLQAKPDNGNWSPPIYWIDLDSKLRDLTLENRRGQGQYPDRQELWLRSVNCSYFLSLVCNKQKQHLFLNSLFVFWVKIVNDEPWATQSRNRQNQEAWQHDRIL